MDMMDFERMAEKETYLKNCCAKEVVRNNVYECNVEKPPCSHFFFYGTSVLCGHPLKQEIEVRSRNAAKKKE